uniref:Plastid lipid-associated protein/fibrillin conserved domain-containing protein n=1 Tax=Chromera velia CCMP2878 TaxID=1169474 RepID=A0A0G4F6H2_9ALVE|mmetsp:Transcript_34255/g.67717  ORF Transcript_34255/g.67717 Transcript_34255/m.67717 type:complete len:377 (+) Transcript_34255:69-1199(+)|eukprot:Cvel_15443.t1-p1 / transcript=Cvel_15443.t1 / gene=Cvel_15443 / organism=Chromera_velia_CCMP2878 / gene_product=hypothetical protein / transcript_product=hypothetical protein / location=Cvel_scaffold1143:10129-11256(+) / protein_length=376 / sequence_SO=supercontig / SO=protein_coding / is_pseudo=false
MIAPIQRFSLPFTVSVLLCSVCSAFLFRIDRTNLPVSSARPRRLIDYVGIKRGSVLAAEEGDGDVEPNMPPPSVSNFAQAGAASGDDEEEETGPFTDPWAEEAKKEVAKRKADVLSAIQSIGGTFGINVNADSKSKVESAVAGLEDTAKKAQMIPRFPKALSDQEGTWRLLYSSALSTGSLGGFRPGPPTLVVLEFASVYQSIGPQSMRVSNVVELKWSDFLLSLPIPPLLPAPTLVLGHSSKEISGFPARLRIFNDEVQLLPGPFLERDRKGAEMVTEKVRARSAEQQGGATEGNPLAEALQKVQSFGDLSEVEQFFQSVLPPIVFPVGTSSLPLGSEEMRGGTFDVSFLDDSLRVIRGDRDEVRVFVRAETGAV